MGGLPFPLFVNLWFSWISPVLSHLCVLLPYIFLLSFLSRLLFFFYFSIFPTGKQYFIHNLWFCRNSRLDRFTLSDFRTPVTMLNLPKNRLSCSKNQKSMISWFFGNLTDFSASSTSGQFPARLHQLKIKK